MVKIIWSAGAEIRELAKAERLRLLRGPIENIENFYEINGLGKFYERNNAEFKIQYAPLMKHLRLLRNRKGFYHRLLDSDEEALELMNPSKSKELIDYVVTEKLEILKDRINKREKSIVQLVTKDFPSWVLGAKVFERDPYPSMSRGYHVSICDRLGDFLEEDRGAFREPYNMWCSPETASSKSLLPQGFLRE